MIVQNDQEALYLGIAQRVERQIQMGRSGIFLSKDQAEKLVVYLHELTLAYQERHPEFGDYALLHASLVQGFWDGSKSYQEIEWLWTILKKEGKAS